MSENGNDTMANDLDQEKQNASRVVQKGKNAIRVAQKLKSLKKGKKSKSLPTIASELEEEEADIRPIYDAVVASAPEYDIEEIKAKLNM